MLIHREWQHPTLCSVPLNLSKMPSRDYLGLKPILANNVYIDPSAQIIGDIKIGANSSIWPLVAARGDVNYIRIGENTNIQDNSVLHVTRPLPNKKDGFALTIGDNVTVGHGAILHGCTIKNHCLIGMGSIVLDGALINDYVMLAAGSVVPPGKQLDSGYVYLGSPAKKSRELKKTEIAWIEKSAENYVKLKNEYLAQHDSL